MQVDVCICTFRRPFGLSRCLRAIAGQRLPDHVDMRVLVIDNDPEAAAARVVERTRAMGYRFGLDYVHEPRRGISHARARAIRELREDAELLAFVDDDEAPEPRWLSSLLAERSRAGGARIVAGPVLPQLPRNTARWKQPAFQRQRHRSGTEVELVGTGNVLLDAAMMRSLDEPFHPALARSGGEDTHLFLRLRSIGERIVWSDEARVVEEVPRSRTSIRWILARAYRGGLTYARCEQLVRPGAATVLRRAARGSLRIVRGTGIAASGLVLGRGQLLSGARLAADGVGVIAGLAGRRYAEYDVTHGR